jgi:hypothetical protein
MKSRSVALRSVDGGLEGAQCVCAVQAPSRWQHRAVGGGTAVLRLWPVGPGLRAGPVPSGQERTVRREWLNVRAVGRHAGEHTPAGAVQVASYDELLLSVAPPTILLLVSLTNILLVTDSITPLVMAGGYFSRAG